MLGKTPVWSKYISSCFNYALCCAAARHKVGCDVVCSSDRESYPYTRYEIIIHTTKQNMKYLLRGIDEVYYKGTDAEGKDEHHLKYNKNNERNG